MSEVSVCTQKSRKYHQSQRTPKMQALLNLATLGMKLLSHSMVCNIHFTNPPVICCSMRTEYKLEVSVTSKRYSRQNMIANTKYAALDMGSQIYKMQSSFLASQHLAATIEHSISSVYYLKSNLFIHR